MEVSLCKSGPAVQIKVDCGRSFLPLSLQMEKDLNFRESFMDEAAEKT